MTKPRLTYFDTPRSRGEECRLALVLAGVDFEDRRVTFDAWAALKPTTPFGSLPTFEVEGKPAVSQSNAILAHIAHSYGLLPDDAWEALRLDSLMDSVEELRHTIAKTFGIKDAAELAAKRAELVSSTIEPWLANMEKQIVGPFAGGARISVADIKLFVVLGWFKGGALDHVPADVSAKCPKLEQLYESVKQHPKVAAWYARS